MQNLPRSTRFAGDITERAELLNGAMQLALDGVAVASEADWTIEVTLSWRLGRAGAVALDEGDLALQLTQPNAESPGAECEVIGLLDAGTAELDAESGSIEVEATFTVEGADGTDLEVGAELRAQFEIGSETWSGELLR